MSEPLRQRCVSSEREGQELKKLETPVWARVDESMGERKEGMEYEYRELEVKSGTLVCLMVV